jgi:hypothetical protein
MPGLAAVKLPSSAQNVSGFDFGFTKRRRHKRKKREKRENLSSLSLSFVLHFCFFFLFETMRFSASSCK